MTPLESIVKLVPRYVTFGRNENTLFVMLGVSITNVGMTLIESIILDEFVCLRWVDWRHIFFAVVTREKLRRHFLLFLKKNGVLYLPCKSVKTSLLS